MNQLQTIPFSGGEIEATIGPDGQPFVNIRRMCEELGLDYSRQLKKLKSATWATVAEMPTVASDGKERVMSFLSARAVSMWAATISVGKVKDELRPRLQAYQLEAAEVLAKHFMPAAPTAMPSTGLARLDALQTAIANTLQHVQTLGGIAVDHEQRLRVLEAKPVVSVVLSTKTADVRRIRTRYNARWREVTGPLTAHMDKEEKEDWFKTINGGLLQAFGERDNWTVEKFFEAARWLKINHGIDITDIENP